MAYIGKNPTTGSFLYADDITTSSTNTYNITVGGVAFSPQESSHVICSLNGVIQKGGGNNPSFSISGSQITFLPSSGTLSSSDSIDFILILGSVNDVGVATTVTDSAITKNKLNLISDSSSAGITVKGDGGSENGTIQLNCSQNSHGIKLSSPSHASGQSYELIFPTGNVTADKVLKVASVSGSGTTGIGQLSFADAGGNTPSFYVSLSSSVVISSDTLTKINFDEEILDSDSKYDTSTYRFTPGVAGTYFFFTRMRSDTGSDNNQVQSAALVKNGTIIERSYGNTGTGAKTDNETVILQAIVPSVSTTDYFEMQVLIKDTSGNPSIIGKGSGVHYSTFGGFRIG